MLLREESCEACSKGIRNKYFSPVEEISKLYLSPKHDLSFLSYSRWSEHEHFSPSDISNESIEHIPCVPPFGARNSTGPSTVNRLMRMSEQQRNTGAARFLVIKGWDKEGGRELESNRAGKQQRYDTIRNPWRVPWMLSRSFPCLKLKQTPLSEPIRDTPPFPYSPAAGATCRLFKLLQWLRSTVETF